MATISKLTESISKNEQKTKELNQQIDARSKSHKILKVSWDHAKCYRLKWETEHGDKLKRHRHHAKYIFLGKNCHERIRIGRFRAVYRFCSRENQN